MIKNTCLALMTMFLTSNVNASAVKTIKACAVAWPPYITIIDGEFGGPDTEVTKKALSNLGYDLEITEYPWKRCLQMAENGQIDLVFSAAMKEDRAKYLHYPSPIHKTAYVFVTRRSEKHNWDKDKDPTKLPQPIASVQGFSVTADLQAVNGVELDTGAVSDQQNFDKFIMGRIPTMIIEKRSANNLLGKLTDDQKQGIIILEPPFSDEKDYFITVSKKGLGGEKEAKEFVTKLDQEIIRMHKSGELDKFYN